jgi:hypothetical protein
VLQREAFDAAVDHRGEFGGRPGRVDEQAGLVLGEHAADGAQAGDDGGKSGNHGETCLSGVPNGRSPAA